MQKDCANKLADIKAVVFDMDGIIFDSEQLVIKCWEIIADKYNISDVKSVCYKCLGTNSVATRQKFLDRYGADFPYDERKTEMAKLFHSMADGGKLPKKPGIKELLEFLKKEDFLIGLASSTRSMMVEKHITEGGLRDYFNVVIGGDMVEKSKPFPDIYEEACRRLGVSTKDAVAIEDSFNGIKSGHRAGMVTIMVPDLIEPDDTMREISDYIVVSHYDVIELFSSRRK